ncbi:M20/M25/M40 family metallo-hydrolase [Bdellovibrionota bacterium FG-2]
MKILLEDAKQLIKIRSVSSDGNEEIANFISTMMSDRGLRSTVQQVTHSFEGVSKRQFNVVGILGDPLVDKKIRKGLLLSTHLDTVSPGILQSWTETGGDPFQAVIRDGKIFGLGSADGKIDFLCKLRAVLKFREKKLRMPIYLAGSCGEELGSFGIRYLIKSNYLNPRYVVVGEPSELKVVFEHKAVNTFKLTIDYQQVERDARGFNRRIDLHTFGRSAHGAFPEKGVNAIHEGVSFVDRAIENGFDLRFTYFEGGDTVSKVPDHSLIQFYLTSHQFEDFKRFFREVAKPDGPLEAGSGIDSSLPPRSFRVEFGGAGDTGIRFLPDPLFPCLLEILRFFTVSAEQLTQARDDAYRPPYSSLNFGRLIQKPGRLELQFDARFLPGAFAEEMEKTVQKGIQKLTASYPSLNIGVERVRLNSGLQMNAEQPLIGKCREAMAAAGMEPHFDKQSSSSEASHFFHAGYEAVGFGPGISGGNAHGPNEYVLVDELEKAVLFYEKLIEKTCI